MVLVGFMQFSNLMTSFLHCTCILHYTCISNPSHPKAPPTKHSHRCSCTTLCDDCANKRSGVILMNRYELHRDCSSEETSYDDLAVSDWLLVSVGRGGKHVIIKAHEGYKNINYILNGSSTCIPLHTPRTLGVVDWTGCPLIGLILAPDESRSSCILSTTSLLLRPFKQISFVRLFK